MGTFIYLNIFKKIKNKKITFIGDGELREECEKYGKVVGFTDPIPYLKKAEFLFTSGYLTILEGLAYGCIVFASYNSPLKFDYYKNSPFKNNIICEPDYLKIFQKYIYPLAYIL